MNFKGIEVVTNRSNISLINEEKKEELDLELSFTEEEFKEFINYLRQESAKIWKDLKVTEATDMGSDYFEYYDRKLDSNGYLNIRNKEENILVKLERPTKGESKVYQFNKRKMGAFLFDSVKIVKSNSN